MIASLIIVSMLVSQGLLKNIVPDTKPRKAWIGSLAITIQDDVENCVNLLTVDKCLALSKLKAVAVDNFNVSMVQFFSIRVENNDGIGENTLGKNVDDQHFLHFPPKPFSQSINKAWIQSGYPKVFSFVRDQLKYWAWHVKVDYLKWMTCLLHFSCNMKPFI